jgi:hypothetical protein
MTIKQQGGIFGRNPTFNEVDVETITGVSGVFTQDLGVGTSSPSAPFVTSNNGAEGYEIAPATAVGGTVRAISFNRSTISYIPFRQQASEHQFYNASTQIAKLTSTGNLEVNVGNLVIGTSGNGIDFSATSGTGTSELFDDYEEGAVANPLYVGGVQVTSGYSANAVSYTKVGDTVMMNFYVDYTSPAGTGPSGNVTIGLPFTPTNSAIAGMSLYMSVSAPSYAGAYISVASGVGTAAVTEANINTIYSLAQGERIIFRAATAYRAS